MDENGVVHRNVARFITPKSLFHQMLGSDHLWPHRFPSHFMTEWDHMESRDVEQVMGAFYLVRRRVFEELKGFDEHFFMYFEDLDFAYRAKRAGWRSYYLADVQALHLGGGSSYQDKAKRLYYVLNSRVLYVAKHFGVPSAIKVLFASFLAEFWVRLGWSPSVRGKYYCNRPIIWNGTENSATINSKHEVLLLKFLHFPRNFSVDSNRKDQVNWNARSYSHPI